MLHLLMTSLLRHMVVLVMTSRLGYGVVMTNESMLYHDLFKDYNKLTYPMKLKNSNKSVKVEFDYQLINILDVSARNQYIKTYAWINQYWTNELLMWNPDDYGGVQLIHVDPRDLWVPDIILYNNIDEEDRYGGGRYTYKANVALKHDGTCIWLNPAIFKSICSVDVTYFPFDDQHCNLKFGSWSFDISKVDLYPKDQNVNNNNYIKNGEWHLRDINSKRNQKTYKCCKYAFADVTVIIEINRNSLDYITKLIIPCSLISSMIFLGFVLPPESGERIGLSITVLLAMTVFQQLTSELMPSYGFPLLGQYYFATMMEIGASLAVTTFILNFYHRSTRRMPRFLRKVVLVWLSRVAFPFRTPTYTDDCQQFADNDRTEAHNESAEENDSFARVENIIDCNNDYSKNKKLGWSNMREISDNQFELSPSSGSIEHVYSNNNSTGRGTTPRTKRGNVHKLRRKRHGSINQQTNTRKASFFVAGVAFGGLNGENSPVSAEQERNQNEWMKAARVLDRLFLVISVVIGTVTLFAIFLRAPRFKLTAN